VSQTESFLAARYCERHGIPPATFSQHLLARTLYPHARPLRVLLGLRDRHYFQADFEFIEDVGYLRSAHGFHEALVHYVNHPRNHSFLRRRLRCRISVRRMLAVVQEAFPQELKADVSRLLDHDGTVDPFASDVASRRRGTEDGASDSAADQ
jgi:hypothetical protein